MMGRKERGRRKRWEEKILDFEKTVEKIYF